VAFRNEREAQRARIDALEDEVAELKKERDRLRAGRDSEEAASEEAKERDELDEPEPSDDELIQEATAERAAELQRAEREAEAERREVRRRRATKGQRERWAVVWSLRGTLHVFLLVMAGVGLLGLLGFGGALVGSERIPEGERASIRLFAVISGLCALGGSVWLARSLLWLRSFRARLPFDLERSGWASLVDHENFSLKEMWRHVVVAVEGGEKAEVSAALDRFCAQANGTFYAADDPTSDQRVRWVRKSARKARGSANRQIAYAIAWFCAHELARLPGRRPVKRVTLRVSTSVVHVSAPSD
jgi:hypothetical protein